ncbi:MAG: hypothetical protein JO015_05845 [Verrucomicrobia bacterium]|nr:hypothetical protein [Verrucomicrobiota bacterium]MBV9998620.1 hypothetical protein [Verrucomicrobiota bacterium]
MNTLRGPDRHDDALLANEGKCRLSPEAPELLGADPAADKTVLARPAAARSIFRAEFGWLLLAFLLTAGITAAVVQWSLRNGRLAIDPTYDDVGYLIDGLKRTQIFDQGGVQAVVRSLVQEPPHSPWSTLVALVAFIFFGFQEFSPYVCNGVPLLLLFGVSFCLIPARFWGVRCLALTFLLSLPLTYCAVIEFRPDFAVALFTASFSLLAVFLAAEYDGKRIAWPSIVAYGLLAGLAFITKPTFVLHTACLTIASVLVAGVILALRSQKVTVVTCLIALAGALGTLSVSAWYYASSWTHILDYIHTNTGSGPDAALWRIPGGLVGALRMHFQGLIGGLLASGRYEILVLTVAALLFLIWRRCWSDLCVVAGGLALGGLSLAIMVYSQVSNLFFGMTWQLIAIFLAVYSMRVLFAKASQAAVFAVGGLLHLVLASYTGLGVNTAAVISPDTRQPYSINERVNRAINDDAHKFGAPARPCRVFVTFAGFVSSSSQLWLALKEHLPLTFSDAHRVADLSTQLAAAGQADYVEVASAGAGWMFSWLPASRLQPEILAHLRADGRFRELPSVAGEQGTVFLFARRTP